MSDADAEAVARVRALHVSVHDEYGPEAGRNTCLADDEDWPCDTIKALDGTL